MDTHVAVSGSQLHRFREGYGLAPTDDVAHWYHRDGLADATALCGSGSAKAGQLFAPGTFPVCPNCLLIRTGL